MRVRNIFILLFIWAIAIQAQNSTDTLKVLTFNVYGAPESEWSTRLGLILDGMELLKPDVICLQEIVETPGSEGADNRAKILADSLFERTGIGYNYVWYRTHFSWDTFDEGIAILSPHIILENDFQELPAGLFNRKCLWANILTPSGVINFYNTHLSFGNQESTRIEQVKSLIAFIDDVSTEYIASSNILCGDFNSIPGSPPIQLLTHPDTSGTVYLDSWDTINPNDPGLTMPSDNPDARIDYVLLKMDNQTEILNSELVFTEPNIDNIFPSDHIGVLSSFNTNVHMLDLNLQFPNENDEIAGTVEISWTIKNKTEDVTYKIYLSNDAGKSWQKLWEGQSATDSYMWNTLANPDGAYYQLKLAAISDTTFGLTKSTGTFVINNPGNAAPELKLKSPKGGELIENDLEIKWEARDADSDNLSVSISYSLNRGTSWQTIAENLENTGKYIWDTNSVPNSTNYMIKLSCTDASINVSDNSKIFSIVNTRLELPGTNIRHIQGFGSGTVAGKSYDANLLTGHDYRISFNDSLPGLTTYNVFDIQTVQYVVEDAMQMDGTTEGPPFDGMRLVIFNYTEAKKDNANTKWIKGNTNMEHSVSLPVINTGNEIISGFPHPADYKITISDQIVDTSSTYLNVPAIPMKFSVQNITDNYPVDVIYFTNDSDYSLGPFDKVYILEKNEAGEPMITWLIFFADVPSLILPEPGDEFVMATLKPFTNQDKFEFTASISSGINAEILHPRNFNLAQNYPNPFNPETIIKFDLPVSAKVELTVYNITGEKIKNLVNMPLSAGSHVVIWDASNLASGLYFYEIKAGQFRAVKKAILIK